MDSHELNALKNGFKIIAGVDEVGRGPLAGPVVAAAVIFPLYPYNRFEEILKLGIKDSKKLSSQKRENLSLKIFQNAVSIGLGIVWPDNIEKLNIHHASQKTMISAVDRLSPSPDFILIDGKFKIPLNTEQMPIVKGDSLSVSIAAASIIAKVARDRIMEGYDYIFPEYNLKENKGYPTPKHMDAIKRYGSSPIHRKGFKGVKEYL